MPRLDKETHVKQAIAEARDRISASGKRDTFLFDSGHRGAIPGFGLRVFESGAATYILKFPLKGGTTRRVSLGDVHLTEVKDGKRVDGNLQRKREWAVEIRDNARVLGKDLHAELEAAKEAKEVVRRELENAPTLRKLAPQYLRDRERGKNDKGKELKKLKPKSLHETRRYLEGSTRTPSVWCSMADVPLSRIKMRQLQDIVESTAKTSGAVTADRARVALSGFFGWAVELGLVDQNPTNDLKPQSLNKSRERTLTETELVEVWWACEGLGEFGSIVRLIILTGQRRAEIGDLAWSEIDLDKRLVELPPRRVKNNRPHLIPLSKQAYAIIEAMPRGESRDLVFGRGAGGFSGWSKAKRELDESIAEERKRIGSRKSMPAWVLHDLRRSFVTHVSERGFGQPHAIEAVVNHLGVAKSGIAGVYNKASYLNEKREILQRWADHLTALLSSPAKPRIGIGKHQSFAEESFPIDVA